MERIKILAVDDEKNVLYRITDTLREYDVTTEASPIVALHLLEKNIFDIIITDYYMPTVNGIELLEEVKEYYGDKRYVAILCTAYGTTYLFEEEKEKGLFHLYLEKPFTPDSLTGVITRSLSMLRELCANEK